MAPQLLITCKTDIRPPTAPVLGTPTTVSSSALSVPLTTAATDLVAVASYALERATSAAGPFTEISSAAAFPYSDTGLATATTYYYRARATDTSGNVGTYSAIVSQATAAGDTVPNAFTFTDQTSVSTSTTITSAAITVSGIDTSSPISITGGTYDINGSGTFVSTPGTVNNGNTVRVRHTSSSSAGTTVSTVLTIGGVSDTFTSTTASAAGSAFRSYTFDSGTTNALISETSMGPFQSRYDATNFFGASGKSARMHISAGSDGFSDWGLSVNFPSGVPRFGEIWMRGRFMFPPGYNLTANPHLKFFRFHTAASFNGNNKGYNDVYIAGGGTSSTGNFRFISEPHPNGAAFDGPATGIVRGTWVTLEFYCKLDTVRGDSGGQATNRLWRNNTLIMETGSLITLNASGDVSDFMYIGTTWNGNAPATQDNYVDDLQVYLSIVGLPGNFDTAGNRFIGGSL